MSGSIWLIIALDIVVIALHISMKFDDDLMIIASIIERKREQTQFYDDSRAVTQECQGEFGRLSNLT